MTYFIFVRRPIGVPITALMSQDYDYFPICKSDELAGTDFPAESPKVGTSTVNLQGQVSRLLFAFIDFRNRKQFSDSKIC
jgi:hypothetical protein